MSQIFFCLNDQAYNCLIHFYKLFEHVLDELVEIKLVFQAWLSYAALRKMKNENRKIKNKKQKIKNEKRKTKVKNEK